MGGYGKDMKGKGKYDKGGYGKKGYGTEVYDDPAYAKVRDQLKQQFARLRQDIGDDGSHHPACEEIVQEFWDYDEADRKKAIQISHDFKAAREASLKKGSKPKKKRSQPRSKK